MKAPIDKSDTKSSAATASAMLPTQRKEEEQCFSSSEQSMPIKLQTLAQNSPDAARIKAFQNMANHSTQLQKAKIDNHKAPIQAKLSINSKNIEKYAVMSGNKIFGSKTFNTVVTDIAQANTQQSTDISQKIDDMANHHLTHVFHGNVKGQQIALQDFMQHNLGQALPDSYRSLNDLQKKSKSLQENYQLRNAFRVDRPSGLASVEELGISRNKEGEASLGGASTQVVDTNSPYTDISTNARDERLQNAKSADNASITNGIEDRVTRNHVVDPTKAAAAFGLGGGVDGSTKTLRTMVRWGPAESDEGMHMIADPLGPDHTLGSTPAAGDNKPWNKARKRMEALTQNTYVAGHLLNEQLGGPGDDVRNLAPITSGANAQHKEKVENEIKRKINKHLLWMYYEVHTKRSDLPKVKKQPPNWGDGKYTSSFECIWGQLDEDGRRIDKRTVTLDFQDPFKGGNTNVTDDQVVTPLSTNLGVRAPKDYRKVVLNTVLKIKSYLIATQTLLPEIERLSQSLNEQSQELLVLQSVFEAYDPLDDILEGTLNDDVEENFSIIDEAIESDEGMEAIYKSQIWQILPYVALQQGYENKVKPQANKQKEDAYVIIDQKMQSTNHSTLKGILKYLKVLIERDKHPTEKAVLDTLHQFEKKHQEKLYGHLRKEREYASHVEHKLEGLEDKHHELKKDYWYLEDEFSIVRRQKQARSQELDRAERKNEQLSRANGELIQENDKLRREKRALQLDLRDSDKELQRRDDTILDQRRQMLEMQRQMDALKREMEQLKNAQQPSTSFSHNLAYRPNQQPYLPPTTYSQPSYRQTPSYTPNSPYSWPSQVQNDFQAPSASIPQYPKGNFSLGNPDASSSSYYKGDDYPSSAIPTHPTKPRNYGNGSGIGTSSTYVGEEKKKEETKRKRNSDERRPTFTPSAPKKYKPQPNDSLTSQTNDASSYIDGIRKISSEAINLYQQGYFDLAYLVYTHIPNFLQEPTQENLQVVINEILNLSKNYEIWITWMGYLGM